MDQLANGETGPVSHHDPTGVDGSIVRASLTAAAARRDRLRAFYAACAAADLAWRMNIEVGNRLSGWVAANGDAMVNADPALDFEGAAPELRSALIVRERQGETTVVIAMVPRGPSKRSTIESSAS